MEFKYLIWIGLREMWKAWDLYSGGKTRVGSDFRGREHTVYGADVGKTTKWPPTGFSACRAERERSGICMRNVISCFAGFLLLNFGPSIGYEAAR